MPKLPTNFKTETQLSTTATELTSVVSGSASSNLIAAVSFYNQSDSVQNVTIYRYLSTNSSSDDNVIARRAIAPKGTWNSTEMIGKVINAGYTLAASAETANVINAECDGVISS
jgi:hypothetical protein